MQEEEGLVCFIKRRKLAIGKEDHLVLYLPAYMENYQEKPTVCVHLQFILVLNKYNLGRNIQSSLLTLVTFVCLFVCSFICLFDYMCIDVYLTASSVLMPDATPERVCYEMR